MHAVSSLGSTIDSVKALGPAITNPTKKQLETKEAFQDFVASTFYKQMLKSLRETQNEPAYFHGGNAEKIFQGQFDQQISEDLAKDHGSVLADPLYSLFSLQLAKKQTDG